MTDSRAARIWRRTVVGAALVAGLAALLWLASFPWGDRFVLALGVGLSIWGVVEAERMGLFGDTRLAVATAVGVFGAATLVFGVIDPSSALELPEDMTPSGRYWFTLLASFGAALVLGGLAALPTVGSPGRRLGARAFSLVLLWLALPLVWLYLVRHHLGVAGLVALLVLAKLGDIAGYYVGNAIGKEHPFPNISPGKTTAGCVASLVAGTVAGAACQAFGLLPDPRFGIVSGLLAGAVTNVAAQAGDLVESVAKRRTGVKDSGRTFGPSGGVLDLVDSLLLATPAALLVWPLLYHWPHPGS